LKYDGCSAIQKKSPVFFLLGIKEMNAGDKIKLKAKIKSSSKSKNDPTSIL
jgi:hypothetical protein